MRLAHPRHRGAVVDLDRVAPEALQDGALLLVEERGGDGLAAFGEAVDLALQLGLEQVGDEVVVVGAEHLGQHPAAHARVGGAGQDVAGQQHLVHDRRRLDEGHGHVGVGAALVLPGEHEVAGVAQLVGEGEGVAHRVRPGHENERVGAVGRGAERARGLAGVVGAVDPAALEGALHQRHVVGAERRERFLEQRGGGVEGHRRLVAGVERRLHVAVQQLVEPEHALPQPRVALHVRRELGLDGVEHVAVELERHLVRLQQVALGALVAARLGEHDVPRDFDGEGAAHRVLVGREPGVERGPGGAAHAGVAGGLVARLVEVERVRVGGAGGIGERRERHVAGLGAVVDGVGRAQHLAEAGQHVLGLGAEHVRLHGQQLVERRPVDGERRLVAQPGGERAVGQGEDLGVDEGHGRVDACAEGGGGRLVGLVARVAAVLGGAQAGEGVGPVEACEQRVTGVEAGEQHGRGGGEPALVLRDACHRSLDRSEFGEPGVARGEQVGEVPGGLGGDFGAGEGLVHGRESGLGLDW